MDALFPPVTKEEVAMVLRGPRQSVDEVFHAARERPTVEGRVDKEAFLAAVCEGVEAGLFGYAETADGAVARGADADLSPDDVRFSGWLILLGTLPAAFIGYALEDFFEGMFARPAAAAGFLLVTAMLLVVTERLGHRVRGLDALIVGLGQALAIFPGISRSGATISAGLARGLKRGSAARFSFLLAMPIILGAGLLKVVELVQMGGLAAQASVLIVGFLAAAAVGFGCIHFLLRYLQRHRLYPFAVHCSVAGIACLLVALL